MLGSPHEANFAGRWSITVFNQGRAIDAETSQIFGHNFSVSVRADNAGVCDLCVEAPQHVGDIGSSTQSSLLAVFAQQDDRSFLADSFGIAPDVAVKDQIADDQDSRCSQPLHFVDEFKCHEFAILGWVSIARHPDGGTVIIYAQASSVNAASRLKTTHSFKNVRQHSYFRLFKWWNSKGLRAGLCGAFINFMFAS